MASKIYEWDASKVSITLDGETVDGFQGLTYRNSKGLSHIRSVNKGAIGYNRTLEAPTFSITVDSTALILTKAKELKTNGTYFSFSYTSPSLSINATNCAISDVGPGSIGETSPSVVITGLALKIDETYTGNQVDGV